MKWKGQSPNSNRGRFLLLCVPLLYSLTTLIYKAIINTIGNEHHAHQSSLSLTNNLLECICETCLGIQSNNPWS